jgi:predicted esterase
VGVLLVVLGESPGRDGEPSFAGVWRTSLGTVTLKQTSDAVTGTYGDAGQFTLKGTVRGKKLTFEYQQGKTKGDGHWTIADSGHSFVGEYQARGGQGDGWNGWRPDPEALKGKPADLGGLWLTNLGLMELAQTGTSVKGRYALRGTSAIEGKPTGRQFEFRYKAFRDGKGWFDVSADGATLAGAATTDGFSGWYGWQGRRAPEFARHAKLVPGKVIDGSTTGLLTYAVRAPEGYKEGDGKTWPTIVILHGSNMSGKMYVNTIAAAWPDVARDFLLIGINGERPSNTGAEPRFNYTYVSYVGRSTFKGFPGTDRESPALVAEALTDLKAAYPVARYFVGGHSQGGFLTYSLLMNFPELIAGAFPISAGVIFQCEPSAYADAAVRAAQRGVPLAIVHGKGDPLVDFGDAEYAAVLFGQAGWPAFRFVADDTGAGHMFGRLPVGEAVRWLEAHASDDPARLLDFAERRMKARGYRDAVAALTRAHGLKPDGAAKERLDRLAGEIDARALAGAAEFVPKVRGVKDKSWIDAFLAYRDDFEFAPAAGDVMKAFDTLRAEHEGLAAKALGEARTAFRQGRRDEGYSKYQEVVDNYYAASSYRNVRRWLAARK